jgi:hypothetical protein
MDTLYFWDFHVDYENREKLKDISKNIEKYNEQITNGVRIVGLYETFIGKTSLSSYQLIIEISSLSALDQSGTSPGVMELHKDIIPLISKNMHLSNKILRKL